jgi:hypothetical protein
MSSEQPTSTSLSSSPTRSTHPFDQAEVIRPFGSAPSQGSLRAPRFILIDAQECQIFHLELAFLARRSAEGPPPDGKAARSMARVFVSPVPVMSYNEPL